MRRLEELRIDDEELADLAALFADAMQTSAAADRHFADRARDLQRECRTGSTTDNRYYRTGRESARAAYRAKQAFAVAWNDETADYDVPEYTTDDL